jgi:hypothetical protein
MKIRINRIIKYVCLCAVAITVINIGRGLYVMFEIPVSSIEKSLTSYVRFDDVAEPVDIMVLKGLPNCWWKSNRFWLHILFCDITQIHGHLFLSEEVDKSSVDFQEVKDLLLDTKNYSYFVGESLSGSNQASLYLKWTQNDIVYEIVVSEETEELYLYVDGVGKRYAYSRRLRNLLGARLMSDVIIK